MTNPTVQQAIIYYRKVADEATRAANSLEGLLKILGEEGEIYFPAPKRKYTRRAKKDLVEHAESIITVSDVRNYIGSASMRVKQIAQHFGVHEVTVRKIITPENGMEFATRGWIRVV